jgi:Ca2+/Na+ antiporter
MKNTCTPEMIDSYHLQRLVENGKQYAEEINAKAIEIGSLRRKFLNCLVIFLIAVYIPLRLNPPIVEFIAFVSIVFIFTYWFLSKKIKSFISHRKKHKEIMEAHSEYKKFLEEQKVEELLKKPNVSPQCFYSLKDLVTLLEAYSDIYSFPEPSFLLTRKANFIFHVSLHLLFYVAFIVNESYLATYNMGGFLRYTFMVIAYMSMRKAWNILRSLL